MNTSNIIEIDLRIEKREILVSTCYQYDQGLLIRLVNVPEHNDYDLRLEMCNSGDAVIKHVVPYSGEDVEIPEDLLTNGRTIQIYVFALGEDWGRTILIVDLNVSLRPSR